MIRDSIRFSNNFNDLFSSCLSCKKTDHRMLACPYFNCLSIAEPKFVINKFIYSKPQERIHFNRKITAKTKNCLFERKNIMKKAIHIRLDKMLSRKFYQEINQTNNGATLEDKEIQIMGDSKLEKKLSFEIQDEQEIQISFKKKFKSMEEVRLFTKNDEIKMNIPIFDESSEEHKRLLSKEGDFTLIMDNEILSEKKNEKYEQQKYFHSRKSIAQQTLDKERKVNFSLKNEETLENISFKTIKKIKKEIFRFEFEKMKEYDNYFQKMNCKRILQDIKKKKSKKSRPKLLFNLN